MDDVVSLLKSQAVLGRGLWIGLYPSLALEVAGHRVDEPHCTLVHLASLGRAPWWTDDLSACSHAAESARSVASGYPSFSTRVGGMARFSSGGPEGDPVVALVGDQRIRYVRDLVTLTMCGLTKLPRSDFSRYDYTPHVTVARCPSDQALSVAPRLEPWPVVAWTHVGVTCGVAHARWPLGQPA